jgi:hypothetical protein
MMKPVPVHTKRIAQLVMRPGGITATEAVAAAEQSLEGLRDRGLSEIAETIDRMFVLANEMGLTQDPHRAGELYTLSNSLVGVAGVFGKSGLGDVALSLCTLIERLLLGKCSDGQAIQLHLDSMRLLAATSMSKLEVSAIGNALRQVVDRLPSERMDRRVT